MPRRKQEGRQRAEGPLGFGWSEKISEEVTKSELRLQWPENRQAKIKLLGFEDSEGDQSFGE